MRALIVGCGRVGGRVALELIRGDDIDVALLDTAAGRAASVAAALGGRPRVHEGPLAATDADVVVLCGPPAGQREAAQIALAAGAMVVSTADALDTVRDLIDLGPEAAERATTIVAGAGFSPGLSCLLARHAANVFDVVDEVHVARSGTGGPACARQHHAALSGWSLDWREGGWIRKRAGSGRQLAHFPEPIGPLDCYRAALPDALLLRRAFPGAGRLTARLAATRRDRLTSRLPMLRRPHPEGSPGSLRVEVWGRRGISREVIIYGAVGPPADWAGVVAARAVRLAGSGGLPVGVIGLAEVADPLPLLGELERRGVHAAIFEGVV